MNKRLGTLAVSLFGLLTIAAVLGAQEHPAKPRPRYSLHDLGTFGGPNSNVNSGSVVVADHGTVVGGADTADWDPICGCPVFHAFKWRDGVLTDLGTLPGGENFSWADAINSHGMIGGASATGGIDPVTGLEEIFPTVWKKNGQIINLGTFGGPFGLVVGISDRGQIIGGAEDAIPDSFDFGGQLLGLPSPTQWHATLWQDGAMQDLGSLGGPGSFALWVNERSQVTGISFTDSTPTVFGYPTVHPFLWQDGHMADLGSLGGVWALSNGLNKRGQVAGVSTLSGDQTSHAFLWSGGTMHDLGSLGGFDFSWANGLNDDSEIVGITSTPENVVHGFSWKRGVMTDLGSVEGYDCSNTGSINAKGQIVGWAFPCDESAPSHAVLWDKQGPGVDLNVYVPSGSNLELTEAQFISDRGEIVGVALLPNGDAHAYALIPQEHDSMTESATAASADDAAAATRSSRSLTHSKFTSERLAALRARIANRRPGFGLRPPKKAD